MELLDKCAMLQGTFLVVSAPKKNPAKWGEWRGYLYLL